MGMDMLKNVRMESIANQAAYKVPVPIMVVTIDRCIHINEEEQINENALQKTKYENYTGRHTREEAFQ